MAHIPTHFREKDPDAWMAELDEVRARLVDLRVSALKKNMRSTGEQLFQASAILDDARRDMQWHAIEQDVEGS